MDRDFAKIFLFLFFLYLELNQEPTVVKDDSSGRKRNNLENKRSLSIQEYDLRTAKKTKADKEFLTNEKTSTSSERGEGLKEEGFESIICEIENMTVNENASPSNLLIKQHITSRHFDGEDKEVARAAQDNQDGFLRTYTSEEPIQEEESLTTVSAAETAESPHDFRLTDQVDAVVDKGSKMKPDEDVTSLHKPIAPSSECSHLNYAAIKRNLSSSSDDHLRNEASTGVLESLLEEKLHVGMEATADLVNRNTSSSVNDPRCSTAFAGKDLPRQIQLTDDSGCPSTLNKEDNKVDIPDKQSKTKNIDVRTPTEKKTYVSSVSVITKKKAKDVFVTVSSADEKRVEKKNLDGFKIQPVMSNMTSREAKRASTELVINVSSNTEESLAEFKRIESEEKFTSTYNKVLNTADGNHGERHASAVKTAPKLQQATVSADAVADFDNFQTSTTSYVSPKESPDNSDTDSFLSAREEVTSETDTTAYLTAQASGSTTSLDYQSLDSDTDTVQLDISLDKAHTPVNSDLEDDVDGPTTPRTLFSTSHYGDRGVQGGRTPSVDLTENELGYGADTESVTSKEDLRQFGVS